jgi:hypothetical protein
MQPQDNETYSYKYSLKHTHTHIYTHTHTHTHARTRVGSLPQGHKGLQARDAAHEGLLTLSAEREEVVRRGHRVQGYSGASVRQTQQLG